jgi:hypothetical protein
MQPLKILALVIIGLPVSAFLLTLFLTDGAPLQPLTPGEESGPAAATRALPQVERERQGSVVAAGHLDTEVWDAELLFFADEDAKPAPMINHDRDAQLFIKLFGTPYPN